MKPDFNNGCIFIRNCTFLTTFFLVVFNTISISQVQYFWAKQAHSNVLCEGSNVAIDKQNNSFLVGYWSFFVGDTITFGKDTLFCKHGAEWADDFLVKYDPNGNVLWARNAKTIAEDTVEGFAVATDRNNNVYETGIFNGTLYLGPYKLVNHGVNSIFLVKYDPVGNVIWVQTAGGAKDDEALSVATDTNSNVYITGYFSSPTISFGSYTLTNAGKLFNIFLAKFDSNGNPLWAKSAPGNGYDIANSVCTDSKNNAYITGVFGTINLKFGSYIINGTGENTFLAKFDPNGNVLWAKAEGGTNVSGANCVLADNADNVYITGYSISDPMIFNGYTLTNPNGSTNDMAYFLVKFDANGNTKWARSATNSVTGYSLATDKCADIFAAVDFPGLAYVGPLTVIAKRVADPVFIARYDSSGNPVDAFAAGTGGDDQCGIAMDDYGNILFGGDIADTIIYGKDTLTSVGLAKGNEAGFIAKISLGNSCCLVKPSLTTCCDTGINSGESTSLNVKGLQGTKPVYNWTPATGLSCSTCPNPIASPTVTTMYYVTMVDSEGCSQTDSLLVKVNIETCGELNVPNVFTPNGDGRNDYFTIQSISFDSYGITIFDRWGKQIYSSYSTTINWDGKNEEGKEVPEGVYYYILKATCMGKEYSKQGYLQLIR